MDVKEYEHFGTAAEKRGLSLAAFVLGGRLVGAVRRRDLPIIGYQQDERPYWAELRTAARAWGQTPDGDAITREMIEVWQRAEDALATPAQNLVKKAHPADLVAARGTLPRLTRCHVWTEPPLAFPEIHFLLFYCWNIFCPRPNEEAVSYYTSALLGFLIQEALMEAITEDQIVSGLVVYSDGSPRSEREGLEYMLDGLKDVGRKRRPSHLPEDEYEDARTGIAHTYLTKELQKLEGLDFDELLQRGLRREIASRPGYTMDLLHYIKTVVRRHKIAPRNDAVTERLDELNLNESRTDAPSWVRELQDVEYRRIGSFLEEHADRTNHALGPKGVSVLLCHLSDPEITDREIAERIGCSESTVGRVNRAIKENEGALREFLGLPQPQQKKVT